MVRVIIIHSETSLIWHWLLYCISEVVGSCHFCNQTLYIFGLRGEISLSKNKQLFVNRILNYLTNSLSCDRVNFKISVLQFFESPMTDYRVWKLCIFQLRVCQVTEHRGIKVYRYSFQYYRCTYSIWQFLLEYR